MERATYSVAELATVLGIGRDSVYLLLEKGIIPHVRPKGMRKYIIPRAAIERWLASVGQAQVVPSPQD